MLIVGLVAALGLSVCAATPASARWAYGDGPINVNVTNALGAQEDQLCENGHVIGFAGESGPGDPATFVAPPGPYGVRTVEVYVSEIDFTGAHGTATGIDMSAASANLSGVAQLAMLVKLSADAKLGMPAGSCSRHSLVVRLASCSVNRSCCP